MKEISTYLESVRRLLHGGPRPDRDALLALCGGPLQLGLSILDQENVALRPGHPDFISTVCRIAAPTGEVEHELRVCSALWKSAAVIASSAATAEQKGTAWHDLRSFLESFLDLQFVPANLAAEISRFGIGLFNFDWAFYQELLSERYFRAEKPLAYLRAALIQEARRYYVQEIRTAREECSRNVSLDEGVQVLSAIRGSCDFFPDDITVAIDLERGLDALQVPDDQRRLIRVQMEELTLEEGGRYLGWDPKRLNRVRQSLKPSERWGRCLREYFAVYRSPAAPSRLK